MILILNEENKLKNKSALNLVIFFVNFLCFLPLLLEIEKWQQIDQFEKDKKLKDKRSNNIKDDKKFKIRPKHWQLLRYSMWLGLIMVIHIQFLYTC